jgi:hypothetical protein
MISKNKQLQMKRDAKKFLFLISENEYYVNLTQSWLQGCLVRFLPVAAKMASSGWVKK